MAKITFDNKVTLVNQPDVARENKVIDDDINEIKSVVNNNAGVCDYSTSETNTGKIWIDGKPIYRKVISFTISSTTNTFIYEPHNINNVDTILPNYSMAVNFNNSWYKVPNDLVIEVYIGSTNITYYNNSSAFTNKSAVVIVEYTKSS